MNGNRIERATMRFPATRPGRGTPAAARVRYFPKPRR